MQNTQYIYNYTYLQYLYLQTFDVTCVFAILPKSEIRFTHHQQFAFVSHSNESISDFLVGVVTLNYSLGHGSLHRAGRIIQNSDTFIFLLFCADLGKQDNFLINDPLG